MCIGRTSHLTCVSLRDIRPPAGGPRGRHVHATARHMKRLKPSSVDVGEPYVTHTSGGHPAYVHVWSTQAAERQRSRRSFEPTTSEVRVHKKGAEDRKDSPQRYRIRSSPYRRSGTRGTNPRTPSKHSSTHLRTLCGPCVLPQPEGTGRILRKRRAFHPAIALPSRTGLEEPLCSANLQESTGTGIFLAPFRSSQRRRAHWSGASCIHFRT